MFDCRFIFREQWLLRPRRPGRPGLRWTWWWWWLVIGDWWLVIGDGAGDDKRWTIASQAGIPSYWSVRLTCVLWLGFLLVWFDHLNNQRPGFDETNQKRGNFFNAVQCSPKKLALLVPFTYFQLSQTPLKTWCGHIFNIWSHQVLKGV